jgi:hypothetical protein
VAGDARHVHLAAHHLVEDEVSSELDERRRVDRDVLRGIAGERIVSNDLREMCVEGFSPFALPPFGLPPSPPSLRGFTSADVVDGSASPSGEATQADTVAAADTAMTVHVR